MEIPTSPHDHIPRGGVGRFCSPVPPSAPSALKGNLFSKAAMSASEIAKLAGSTAASGGYLSRRRSQARSSSLSSRSAARTNASKNRWRCAASSRPQPSIIASNRSTRRISREPLNEIQHRLPEKRKSQIRSIGGVARSPRISMASGGP